jgi:hypothetical protein
MGTQIIAFLRPKAESSKSLLHKHLLTEKELSIHISQKNTFKICRNINQFPKVPYDSKKPNINIRN